jgi:TatD DNase family protein
MLTDSHCHLASDRLWPQAGAVIHRALEAGVTRLVAIGTDLRDGPRVLELAAHHANVWATVGIHPCDVMEITAPDMSLAL